MPDSHELSVYLAEVSALPGPSGNPYFDVGVDATRLFVGLIPSETAAGLSKRNLLLSTASEPHDRSATD